jgi:LPPG:FO 2-phospho-L-lactate transferase
MTNVTTVVALAGGVGGAKLATGLQAALPPGALTVIVNTGDDFEHWGLDICPDLDTMLYNLAGIHNPETGWGRAGESFATLRAMSLLGGEEWFRLGDQDLALHLRRTEWLRQGVTLTEVTDRLRRSFGVVTTILPMCDDPVRTLVHTDEGDLPFQHYFVRCQCAPAVADLSYVGADHARPSEAVAEAVAAADLIVMCPSNPYLSLDPILSVSGLRKLLYHAPAPIIGVTPIVAGAALKGPTAKMMRELGQMPSPLTVVDHFADLLDGFVLDRADAVLDRAVELPVLVTDTVMTDVASKTRLAAEILDFATRLDSGALQPRSLDTGHAMP